MLEFPVKSLEIADTKLLGKLLSLRLQPWEVGGLGDGSRCEVGGLGDGSRRRRGHDDVLTVGMHDGDDEERETRAQNEWEQERR